MTDEHENEPKDDRVKPTESQLKARRSRAIAIGIALVIFVILVYFGTLFRLGPAVFNRPL